MYYLALLTLALVAVVHCKPEAIANNVNVAWPLKIVQLKGDRSKGQYYKWRKLGGGNGWKISDSTVANPFLEDLTPGKGIFQLTVIDVNGETSEREVIITVRCESPKCEGPKFPDDNGKCIDHDCPPPASVGPSGCRGCPKHSFRKGSDCDCKRGMIRVGDYCYNTGQ